MKKLRGITWNHSRGFVSVVATAQRFMEMNPDIEITWEKRSLQHFADYPIHHLIEHYDLLVIDHPWAGFAVDQKILVPLHEVLPQAYLSDQEQNSVGKSHLSYNFGGIQTALAIDAATPVASYRPDLFAQQGLSVPQTWEEVLELAKKRKIAIAGIPIDVLMAFYMMCVTQGEEPFVRNDEWISLEMGMLVLEQLRELASMCPPEIFDWNPIRVMEAMSSREDIVYCPFAYGYSNYARTGYAKHLIHFTDLVSIGNHGKLKSTLGGTGLAISVRTPYLQEAVEYAKYTASPDIQKTLYVQNGGQPGHRIAWLDEEVNRQTHQYFQNTLPALDRAYLRPRYPGYFHFQDHAGDYVRDYLRLGGNPKEVLANMNRLYLESLQEEARQ